jgi:hypothetical protein
MPIPPVRRTFAPKGETPIHQSWDRPDRISAIGAITGSPKWKRLRLSFHLMPANEDLQDEDMVALLKP